MLQLQVASGSKFAKSTSTDAKCVHMLAKAYPCGWQCQGQHIEGAVLTRKAVLTSDTHHVIDSVAFQWLSTTAACTIPATSMRLSSLA